MDYKRLFAQLIGLNLALLLFVSCQTSQKTPLLTFTPIPTVAPTPVPTDAQIEWNLLTFGDSRTGHATWPKLLAGFIEADLGVDVRLNNRAGGGQVSEELLERLRENERERQLSREADFLTILTMNQAGTRPLNGNDFSKGCPTAEYEIILEEIIKEILTLREGNPFVFRLLEHYNYPGVSPVAEDLFSERKACFEQYNQSIHALAEKYNILVVPVYAAFNGPTGDENPDEKGYISDGIHLSPAGDIVIADLFREMGYEPRVP
jgi:lysophospholipase L1-like esterase